MARQYGISSGQLYTWRHALLAAQPEAVMHTAVRFARVDVKAVRTAEHVSEEAAIEAPAVVPQLLANPTAQLDALQMIDSTTIRAHRCAAGETGGTQFQALGRSRGGFTTKVHLRCNAVGLPVGVVLTTGEAHEMPAYDALMEQRDSDPGAMLADKGYDSDAIRHDLRDRGAAPEIPTKRNRKATRGALMKHNTSGSTASMMHVT